MKWKHERRPSNIQLWLNNSNSNSNNEQEEKDGSTNNIINNKMQKNLDYNNDNNNNNNDNNNNNEHNKVHKVVLDQKIMDDEEEEQHSIDSIYILPLFTTIIISIGLLILLHEKSAYPMSTKFDVDFYMVLDDTLKQQGNIISGGDDMNMNININSIVGISPLSPAEKIVGALFGPPSGNKY